MELKGKAKDDFYKWIHNSEHAKHEYCSYQESSNAPRYEFKYEDVELPEILENTLIIEFFDSVYIYIETWQNDGFCWQVYSNLVEESPKYNNTLKTRPEAQNEAIKKANQIYNEL